MKNVADIYPLSPLQESLLLHVLSAPGSRVGFEQTTFDLGGDLDVDLFGRAWQILVDRHSMLRTCFLAQGVKQPLQVVRAQVKIDIEQHDWRHLDAEAQVPEMAEFRRRVERRGFDPRTAPLMHLALIRLSDEAYRLVWSYSHLLIDGWCRSLILEEVFKTYRAFAQAKALKLPEPTPYRTYIEWLERQDQAAAEAYWRQRLEGLGGPTPLMIDRLPSSVATPEYRTYDFTERWLGRDITARLDAFGRSIRSTTSTLVQGAWALLLGRLSGQGTVAYGTTVSGRPADLPNAQSIVGMFVNNLPVVVDLPEDTALAEWLVGLQGELAEMRSFEYCSPSQVQGWSRVAAGQRLFESLVLFQNYPVEEAVSATKSSGLQMGGYDFRMETGYPLTLVIGPGKNLLIRLYHERGPFDPAAIEALLEHYIEILGTMADHGDIPLADLPLTGPRVETDAVETGAEETGADETGANEPWRRRADALARALRQGGLGDGDAVLIPMASLGDAGCTPLDAAIACRAVLDAGGVAVPVGGDEDALWAAGRTAGVRFLVAPEALVAQCPPGVHGLAIDTEQTSGEAGTPETAAGSRGAVLFPGATGSDGSPTHHTATRQTVDAVAVDTMVLDLARRLELAPGDRVTVASPSEPWLTLLGTLATWTAGAEWVDPDGAPTVWMGSPAALAAGTPDADRVVILCGSATPGQGLRTALDSETRRVWLLFGGAACGGRVCCSPWTPDAVPGLTAPLGGGALEVRDAHGRPLPLGAIGRLAFLDPEGTATGVDLAARFLPDGRVEVLGPWMDAPLGEGAALLRRRADVVDATVLRRDDDVRALVVLATGDRAEGNRADGDRADGGSTDGGAGEIADTLRRSLRTHLPSDRVPTTVAPVESLPRRPDGTLDTTALTAMELRTRRAPKPPSNPLELRLVQLFETTFDLRPIGVDEGFFELGGHSMLALRLVQALKDELGVEMQLADLVGHATVERLAQWLDNRDGDAGDTAFNAVVPIHPSGSKPPFFCVHAAGGVVMSYVDLAYLLGPEQPFYGLQARGLKAGEEPIDDLQAMGRLYVEAIREVQPEGPYHLGGWSFGGLVAFEMAQQLRAMGHEVALVALLDAGAGTRAWGEVAEDLDHAEYLVAFLSWLVLLSAEDVRRQGDEEAQIAYAIDTLRNRGLFPPGISEADGRRLFDLYRAHADAVQRYTFEPYDGRLTLLRSRQGLLATGAQDDTLGWQGIPQGGLEIHEVDGPHRDLIRRPWVEDLANRLGECLAAAGAQQSEAEGGGAPETTEATAPGDEATAAEDAAAPKRRRRTLKPRRGRRRTLEVPKEGSQLFPDAVRQLYGRLSPAAARFLDHVESHPALLRRQTFQDAGFGTARLQPWPLHVDRTVARHLESIARDVLDVAKTVLTGILGDDPEALVRIYGLEPRAARSIARRLGEPGTLEHMAARLDFVVTERGLQCQGLVTDLDPDTLDPTAIDPTAMAADREAYGTVPALQAFQRELGEGAVHGPVPSESFGNSAEDSVLARLLGDPRTLALASEESASPRFDPKAQRTIANHVPWTRIVRRIFSGFRDVDREPLEAIVRSQREHLTLIPCHGDGEPLDGASCDDDTWRRQVLQSFSPARAGAWVAQERPRSLAFVGQAGDEGWKPHALTWQCFVQGETWGGVRLASTPLDPDESSAPTRHSVLFEVDSPTDGGSTAEPPLWTPPTVDIPEVRFSDSAKAIHGDLSPVGRQFLEFLEQRPEGALRSNFRRLDDPDACRRGEVQSWPVIIDRRRLAELESDAARLAQLVVEVPERLLEGDPERIASFYDLDPTTAEDMARLLQVEGYAVGLIGRGDFILGAEGLRCVEINVSGLFGGWDNALAGERMMDIPYLKEFFEQRPEDFRVRYPNPMGDCFTTLIEAHREWCEDPPEGPLHLAFIQPDAVGFDRMGDEFWGWIGRQYQNRLADAGLDPTGQVFIGRAGDLEERQGDLYFEGHRVGIVLELCKGRVPQSVIRAWLDRRICLSCGPLMQILSDKRNLALLSEHAEDTSFFSAEERALLRNTLPWTRMTRRGFVDFHGQRRPLAELLLEERERWVVKPGDSFGGRDVAVGKHTDPETWAEVVGQALDDGSWVVQEQVESLPFQGQVGAAGHGDHNIVWGFFFRHGKPFGDSFLRMLSTDRGGVVNHSRGAASGVLWVVEDPSAKDSAAKNTATQDSGAVPGFTPEIHAQYDRLSLASRQFLEYTEKHPEMFEREAFSSLAVDETYVRYPMLAWPVFFDRAVVRQLEGAAKGLARLIRRVPELLLDKDPARLSEVFGFEAKDARLLTTLLDHRPMVDGLLTRGDYVLSESGLQCLEINFDANLGGWQSDQFAGLYHSLPVLEGFFGTLGRSAHCPSAPRELFRSLASGFLEHFELGHSTLNTVFLKSEEQDAGRLVEIYGDAMNQHYSEVLAELRGDLEGRVTFCHARDLVERDGHLFFEGSEDRPIQIVVEHCRGRVPRHIFTAWLARTIHLVNGPLTNLFDDKRNLALLSEYAADLPDDDRWLVEAHIPWSRVVRRGFVDFHGERSPLADLLAENPQRFVLKSARGQAGREVFVGQALEADAWGHAIDQAFEAGDWIAQERVESLPFVARAGERGHTVHDVVWGLFLFGDTWGGGFLRSQVREEGHAAPINSAQGSVNTVLFEVDDVEGETERRPIAPRATPVEAPKKAPRKRRSLKRRSSGMRRKTQGPAQPTPIRFTPEVRQTAEQLSAASARFLDFVESHPEAASKASFAPLEDADGVLAYPLQPWPQFIDAAAAEHLGQATCGVLRLIKAVPTRLLQSDPEALRSTYGLDPEAAQLTARLLEVPGAVDTAVGRGDFVATDGGFKCLEMNSSGNLGGWQTPAYVRRYGAVPLLQQFQQELAGADDVRCVSVLGSLFEHLARSFLTHGRSHDGPLDVAIVRPNEWDTETAPEIAQELDRELAGALGRLDSGLEGRVSICHYDDLVPRGGVLHLRGKPIRLVIEHHLGHVAPHVLDAWLDRQAIVINGPLGRLFGDKRNLALLSEHVASDLFDDDERRLIQAHVPWSRSMTRQYTEFEGDRRLLEELVLQNRERFVLKPCRGAQGKDVLVGPFCTDATWRKAVLRALTKAQTGKWLVQEYHESLPFAGQLGDHGWAPHDVVWGLFALGASWGGGFIRSQPRTVPESAGAKGIINSSQGARETLVYEVAGLADPGPSDPGPADAGRPLVTLPAPEVPPEVRFSDAEKATHGKLSALNVRFLEYLERRPEGALRTTFRQLDTSDELMRARVQSWPLFIDRPLLNEFEDTAARIAQLVIQAPKRILGADPKRIADFYGIELPRAKVMGQLLKLEDYTTGLAARGDFLLSPDGLRCVEVNVSGFLGGWDNALAGLRMRRVPFFEEFLAEQPTAPKLHYDDPLGDYFGSLIDAHLEWCPEPPDGPLNMVIVQPKEGTIGTRGPVFWDWMQGIYRRQLEARGLDTAGRMLYAGTDELEEHRGKIFVDDHPVHSILEICEGRLPRPVLVAWLSHRISVSSGPLMQIINDKRNLALLSEHADDASIFDADDRSLLTHVPWTRIVQRGSVTFEGERRDLGQLLVERREDFVIKPGDSYGGKDVAVGGYTPPDAWKQVVERGMVETGAWVAQQRVNALNFQGQIDTRDYGGHHVAWGLFSRQGQSFGGGFLRLMPVDRGGVVNRHQGALDGVLIVVESDD